ALRLDQGDPAREEMHRLRLASVLRQCPRLEQVWFHHGGVRLAQFSPDGRRVLTASDDGTARVWAAATGQPAGPEFRHQDVAHHAASRPDGRQLVTAGGDGCARVWDADTGKEVTTLRHGRAVTCAAFRPDGKRVVTAGEDPIVYLWDVSTGK